MTAQERINGVVERVMDITEKANTPEEESNQIMEELAEMAYGWLEAKAAAETLMVIIGLMVDKYPPNLAQSFMRECVQFTQYDELSAKKTDGVNYIRRAFDPEIYDQLMQMFLEQARDELLPEKEKPEVELVYEPSIADEYRAEQAAKAGKEEIVEIVDKVPDVPGEVYMPGLTARKSETDPVGKIQVTTREEHTDLHSAGRKNGPGVKTAEKIRKATNAPVKKTGAARKATTGKTGGAADGK